MFNYFISSALLGAILCVSYGNMGESDAVDKKNGSIGSVLSEVINQQRLKHSNLSVPPSALQEERHRFVLGRQLKSQKYKKPETSEVKEAKKEGPKVRRLSEDDIKTVQKVPLPKLEKVTERELIKFDWTMMAPVKAAVTKKFGEGDEKLSRGIVFDVYNNQTVHAPVDGEVIFAGPLKGFGYVVMIEKDMMNIVLVAGISYLEVKQGVRVYRGQKIGAMIKDSWVYLEFRNEGVSIDPQQVLVSG